MYFAQDGCYPGPISGEKPAPVTSHVSFNENATLSFEPGKTYRLHITDIDEHPIDLLSVTVSQHYSVLVTARNDAGCNWAIHANMDMAMFSHVPDTLQPNVTSPEQQTSSQPWHLHTNPSSPGCRRCQRYLHPCLGKSGGGVFNILLLMGANPVGFVLGVDGARYFVHELTGGWDCNPRNSIRANDGVANMGTLWWSGSRCHQQEQEQNDDDDDDDDPDLILTAAAPWTRCGESHDVSAPHLPPLTQQRIQVHAEAEELTRPHPEWTMG
ncbi:hypothetical protein BGW80DRAFT_1252205 [Lactifluus volemus]|nr:hypothetical protein BGW80DRAFT_1252205 [Lactifluus volemus]